MPEVGPIIADSGPLIVLAAVGQLDLVGRLYGDDALLLLARLDPAARLRPLHAAFRHGRPAPPLPLPPEADRARLAAFVPRHHELRAGRTACRYQS